jgi:hypothetical protein
MIEAAMKAAPAVEQEPVGFIGEDPDHGTRMCKREIIAECWLIPYLPLYTHPQPKREPLSESEIKQIFEQSIGLMYWDFAKAIEKAHGIGAE